MFKGLYNEFKGNISRLAKELGITRPTVRAWIEKMERDNALIERACKES